MSDSTKTRGRPPKPDSERRDHVLYLKLTAAEKRLIDEADDCPSVWARELILRAAKKRLAKK